MSLGQCRQRSQEKSNQRAFALRHDNVVPFARPRVWVIER
jgi:hypothetical protein